MKETLDKGLEGLQGTVSQGFGEAVPDDGFHKAVIELNVLVDAVELPEGFYSEQKYDFVDFDYGTLRVADFLQDVSAQDALNRAAQLKNLPKNEHTAGLDFGKNYKTVSYLAHQAASGLIEAATYNKNMGPSEALEKLSEIRVAQNALVEALGKRGVDLGVSPAREITSHFDSGAGFDDNPQLAGG